MVFNREEAAQRAEASNTNSPGTCQLWTRTQFGAPSAGDQDRDGDADAVDGWKSEPPAHRHNDRNPPRGVPVAWGGGSHGFGHRAISLGNGKIRSTDAGGSGKVATVDLNWPEKNWGLDYLGWSDTITGQLIPMPSPPSTPLRVDGADISHHQSGKLDLPAFKKAGGQFLYHKATEGNGFVDPNYARRRTEAAKAGIPFGAYHFARASLRDAKEEAAFFLATATPQPGDLVPALDIETNDTSLTAKELNTWVGTFVQEIRKALHVHPFIYTPYGVDDWGSLMWRARWPAEAGSANVPPYLDWDIWQFSNGKSGVPSTFTGVDHVDLNHMRDGLKVGDFRIPVPDPDPIHSGVIRFVTQNIRALPKMPQPDVAADVTLTAAQAGVICWQEIGPKPYKQAIADLGPEWSTFAPDGAGNSNPISWRSKVWTECATGSILLNAADPVIRGTDRNLVWVLLKHNGTGAFVLVNNAHYVARAWGHRTGHEAQEQPARQAMWNAANKIHRAAVADWVAKGYAVVSMGDYNSSNQRELPLGKTIGGRTVRYTVGPKPIDQVCFVNGTDWVWVIDDTDGELLPGRNSDHQGRRGQARLAART